jgi:GT2 family glycosyltransferase/glycosyltransferase involved in cell wall biosynthesis
VELRTNAPAGPPQEGFGHTPLSRSTVPVDIIVPVYGAAAEFQRCLDRLLAYTNWTDHRLVVVDDCGPDFPSAELLEQAAARHHTSLLLLRNPFRRGFVGSVNRAMALSEREVVLLNSDTEVTAGWLGKLQQAAYSSPEIATVTPFSNDATICSLPRFLEANSLPAGYDLAAFATLVESVSRSEYPRLPTGVGMCLYIKREALRRVGLFDERRFRFGYGEDSDFCMRAREAGYAHVLDDATFIFHAGQRSFGTSRNARVRRAERLMRRLHPEYRLLVSQFIEDDPLRPIRERITRALYRPRVATPAGLPSRVLHLVHGWPPYNPAGTEIYARSLAIRQAADREVASYARIADRDRTFGDALELIDQGVRVRLLVNNFVVRDPFVRNALYSRKLERDFDRFLTQVGPQLLHVHHLSGHAITLLKCAARRQVPIVYQIHDWWAACARANFLDSKRHLCSGPGAAKCSACLPLTKIRPACLWNPLLYAYRAAIVKGALRRADAFLTASSFAAENYRRLGLLEKDVPVHVITYGVEPPAGTHIGERRAVQRPIRFGFIGSILPHKGVHVAVNAFRGIDPDRATLEIWGDPTIDPTYTAELATPSLPQSVRMNGRFRETARDEVLAAIDVLLVPSLGLESFGLVVREAMSRKLPVMMSRQSALAELSQSLGEEVFFEPGSAQSLRAHIEHLIEHPEKIAVWRSRLPVVKSIDEHAGEVDRIYEAVLRRRRQT